MRVGIGLPTTTPGAHGDLLLDWCRRADAGPFASLGFLDRVSYESYEPFTALGAAAAATARVELVTMIVIAPIRSAALLAKQAATVDALSGGRLTLGVSIGARRDDYDVTASEYRTRGRRLSDQLGEMRSLWEEGGVGPKTAKGDGPTLLVGGLSGAAFARMARYGDGYVHGGGPPRAFEGAASKARAAWADLGRPGSPLLYGQGYFALGDEERGAAYLRDYYAFTGPFADKVAAANLATPQAITDFVRGYEEAGCDELVLLPTVSDPAQLDRLAAVLGVGERPGMRIQVVGAGPAGLYFALLMRRADPSNEVTVTERNPDGASFGWGVVFSEETLGALRDADPESHAAITDSFARWDAIEIRYRDEILRSRGHAFTGIARPRLLAILRDRCLGVGVDLRFEREVPDPFALEADLVLAADGVHSFTRRSRPEAFGASEHARGTKFVWLGVDHAFKAFTFIFRETPHGMFQVHAYPFDGRASTFIVECHESTWTAAGLAEATEQDTIAFCQELFAEELGGRKLMSNRSTWASFVTVRCESWHQGRVALAGDAAHTAHFTIGSGTKLAMEDSIALAQALRRHKDVERALVEYEMERQPVVDRFQQAAAESASYFENVRRYSAFAPIQFGFNLLTRSGRIGHTNLSLRDPDFVRRVDAWFADRAQDAPNTEHRTIAAPPLFAPLSLRGLRLANRAVLSPVSEDGAEDGAPQDAHLSRLTAAARSGAGLVLTEMAAVSAQGRVTPGSVGMYLDGHVGAWSRVTWFVHELTDARIGLQLGHAGRRGSTRPRRFGVDRPLRSGNWRLLSASALRYGPRAQTPFEVDERDMGKLIDQFAQAARMASWADFDLLELHMAHGYLLAGFLSPLANVRTDAFGGTAENRLRFPLQVFDAVRDAWPEDRPLTACIPATDWAPGGLDVDGAVEVARALRDRGCDAVRVLGGQTTIADRPDYGRAYLAGPADRIRNEAGIPVVVGGGLTTHDQANTILAAGRADLCLMDLPELEHQSQP